MKHRPFIIDENILAAIAKVKAYAEVHPLTLIDLVRRMDSPAAVGDDQARCCHIPWGYRAVYSVEMQVIGRTHHLSVSVDDPDPDALPHAVPANLILWAFGIGAILTQDPEELTAMKAILECNKIPAPETATIIMVYAEQCDGFKALNIIAQLEKDKTI